MKFCKII